MGERLLTPPLTICNSSSAEDIWAWVSYPLPEKDQVVPHTPETKSDYGPTMPLPLTPISIEDGDDVSFEGEEETVEEAEKHDEEFGGEPTNS
ncbi:unnamed protein product [Lactuca saligna]|uniref:Uncharacterized protein n=1 Tax=Lactuca saligna TaxID=75948 RepID=A0AA35ZFU3_LACSI|nr:unnamed protein product [Lactuca saligna]